MPTDARIEEEEDVEERRAAAAKAVVAAPPASVSSLNKEQRRRLYRELGLFEQGFTIGVLNLFVNVLVLARWPQYFWILHLFLGAVLLPWRFLRFRQRNLEWYMVDFCYFVTYYTVVGCILALCRCLLGVANPLHQYNLEAIRVGFAFANGALALSVPLFGNKLVFHDVDNTTSVYIHLSPALFFWCLRWGGGFGTSLIEQTWPGMFAVCRDMQEGDAAVSSFLGALWYSGPCAGSAYQFMLLPAAFWIVLWCVPYCLINFCCLRGYLERNNKENLFISTIKDQKGTGRFLANLSPRFQPPGFMLQHFLWTTTAGCASILLWRSFALHTAMLLTIFLCALHNGSTFTFRVVAARYVQNIVTGVAESGIAETKGEISDVVASPQCPTSMAQV